MNGKELELFINRFKGNAKNMKKMERRIKGLNRIYEREAFYIDHYGCFKLKINKDDKHIRMCNFFVYPTHKLYYNNGNSIESYGLAVNIYCKDILMNKYIKICLNLNNDMIEKGGWVSSNLLDSCYDQKKGSDYHYLRSALKLATIILNKKDIKIFDRRVWNDVVSPLI